MDIYLADVFAAGGRPGPVDQLVAVDEKKQIAVDAYTYSYSLITTNVTRVQVSNEPAAETLRGPVNSFLNVKRCPPADFLTLDLPHKSPRKGQQANWFPAPTGASVPMLRMYWPKATPPSIIDGTLNLPTVEKVKGMRLAR